MKSVVNLAGAALGLLFVFTASLFFLGKMPPVEIPKDTPPWYFMQALGPTGYMTMVKIVELVGGVLTAIPKTRNFGLLFLGPVIVNILAFHIFLAGDGLKDPMVIGIAALGLFLLLAGRKAFLGLRS